MTRRCSFIFATLFLGITFLSPAAALALPVEVLLLGDSITHGMVSGPEGMSLHCESGDCYAARIAEFLGPDYEVVNGGASGATSVDWTAEEPGIPFASVDGVVTTLFEGLAVPNLPADIVTIMLGVNDAVGLWEPTPVAPADYSTNIQTMITHLFELGAGEIILIKPTPAFPNDAMAQLRLRLYREALDDLCDVNEGVSCAPDPSDYLTEDDFEGTDVHPNAAGHEKIAISLAEAILAGSGEAPPCSDIDGDGVCDVNDLCPTAADPSNADSNDDGIGNACQCGDVTGDGFSDVSDAGFIQRAALGLANPPFIDLALCDVTGDGRCDVNDSGFILRRTMRKRIPPFVAKVCDPNPSL